MNFDSTFLIFFVIAVAVCLPSIYVVFKLCDELANVLQEKYPDLYEKYSDRLKGNRRSPFFIFSKEFKELHDEQIDAISKKLMIVLLFVVIVSWIGVFLTSHFWMKLF